MNVLRPSLSHQKFIAGLSSAELLLWFSVVFYWCQFWCCLHCLCVQIILNSDKVESLPFVNEVFTWLTTFVIFSL